MHSIEIKTFLNERVPVTVILTYGFIAIQNASIDKEKRDIYQAIPKNKLPLGTVPLVALASCYFEENQQNKSFLKFIGNMVGYNTPEDQYGKHGPLIYALRGQPTDLFDVIVPPDNEDDYTANGRLFNMMISADKDDMYNYSIARYIDKSDLSKKLFLDANTETVLRQVYRASENAIKKWFNIKTTDNIKTILNNAKLQETIRLNFVQWAHYIKFKLFNKIAYNRLLDGHVIGQFVFMVIDTNDKFDWKTKIDIYRSENEAYSTVGASVMQERPVDEQLVDSHFLNFAAYDMDNKKMVGYVTCRLKNVNHKPYDEDEPFKIDQLDRLNKELREMIRDRGYDGFGFDIFAIDGLHVHQSYRNHEIMPGVSIAKMLLYCAIEFIVQSHKDLGVKMVMCYAFAAATKSILTGSFGFSHYDRTMEISWILNHLEELGYALDPLEQRRVATPEKFLSLKSIRQNIQKYLDNYYPPLEKDRSSEKKLSRTRAIKSSPTTYRERQKKLKRSVKALTTMIEKYPDPPKIVNGKGEASIKFRNDLKDAKNTLTIAYNSIVEMTPQEKADRKKKHGFIGIGQMVDDTYLSLSNERQSREILDSFFLKTKQRDLIRPFVPTIVEEPIVIDDIDYVDVIGYTQERARKRRPPMDIEEEIDDPTENDMKLYDEMIQNSMLLLYTLSKEEREEEENLLIFIRNGEKELIEITYRINEREREILQLERDLQNY